MVTKDFFTEYKLNYKEKGEPTELFRNELSRILRFVKTQSIKDYTISGLTNKGEWKILMKIGK